ncbi:MULTISPECIES: TIGR01777 family oxidoreductase [Flavobacteriaceae]|uniref:TIGR01777 family protein n=2 Tax=Flavobacteriaceae TaxID=49546 RepID=A0A4Y8AV15_9FLAO|nr:MULTISPECIES: TIGR01777 family oxidoreductase [Flavobacteriaceae]TEW75313.1 TIGR01777 family protein [Gramella jeungdoensis]GGK44258.1 NAD-dependent epimerase [Lutibacter litoralis]
MASILVTGGTGLIGSNLCDLLKSKGHNVSILSRSKIKKTTVFHWDIEKRHIDNKAIINTDYIIHLAGAGIADKRWTKSRKKELIASRVNSTNLLFEKVKELNPDLKGFISSSGVGYYGAITSEKIFQENDTPNNDFLSKICILWEKEVNKFNSLNIRTVILRTGVVFSKEGGALEKIIKPIKLGVGAALGSGKQYIPWIAMEDLCNMYVSAIENAELNGVYNAVAPEHITNQGLTKSIAKTLKKSLWLPNVPSFVLKIALGELAVILLQGSRVSSEKIKKTGFNFIFPTIEKYFSK